MWASQMLEPEVTQKGYNEFEVDPKRQIFAQSRYEKQQILLPCNAL